MAVDTYEHVHLAPREEATVKHLRPAIAQIYLAALFDAYLKGTSFKGTDVSPLNLYSPLYPETIVLVGS